MANAVLFKARIVRADSYADTNQTRVLARITHADVTGELDPDSDWRNCRLEAPILVSFRLDGQDALAQRAMDNYGSLPDHYEVNYFKGGTIFFVASGIAEGRRRGAGEPVCVLQGFVADSLSFEPRRRRVPLVFAGESRQVTLSFEDDLFNELGEVIAGADAQEKQLV